MQANSHPNQENPNPLKLPKTGSPLKDCLHFFLDVEKYHQRLAKIAPVVDSGFSFLRAFVLFGPEANAIILNNKEGVFSSQQGWEIILKRVFPGAIMSMDGDHHRYQRRIMNYAFKKEVLVVYLDSLNTQIDSISTQWEPQDNFLVFDHIKQMTLDLASHVFMGLDLQSQADKINRCFIDMVNASITPIRIPIPFTPMHKGVKARKQIVKYLGDLLPEKRAKNTPDFFSQFCHAMSEDGEKFTDDEIIDHMAFLMMAAHDTTTSTLTTMFYLLAKHPEWQETLRNEAIALNKPSLNYDDLKTQTSIELVMQETLRMYPPLPSLMRVTTQDVEILGYTIPKGRTVAVSPIQSHYCSKTWSNPYTFDPQRFSEERKEHKQHSHAYIPFGGGAHKCLGQRFAEMQVKTILFHVLKKYKWSVPNDYEMPFQRVPISKPKDGLPIKLERLN